MEEEKRAIEKFMMIEKAVSEMLAARQQIIELRESETQRRKFIEELQASEKRYRTLVENIPQKLFMKDENLRYIFCSPNYAADLGINPQEIVGRTDHDFSPGELADKLMAHDERIMQSGQLEETEERYISGGQESIVHLVKTPVKDENGDIVGLLGIFWDITEEKRKETELMESRAYLEELVSSRTAELHRTGEQLQREITDRKGVEEQLRRAEEEMGAIFENSGTAAVILEEDLTISQMNREFEELSGFSRGEVEGKKSLAEFTKDNSEGMKEYCLGRKTDPDSVPRNYEYPFIDSQGNVRNISMTVALIPGTKRVVAYFLDITDRRRMEEALRRAKEMHQGLVENANVAIIVIQDGRVEFINPKGIEIFKYSEEEFTSRPALEFIHPDDREMVELHLRRLKAGGLPRTYSFRIIQKDDNLRWVENREALISWAGGPAVLNSLTDITERKQAEEELSNSIEPLRALMNAIEKILPPVS